MAVQRFEVGAILSTGDGGIRELLDSAGVGLVDVTSDGSIAWASTGFGGLAGREAVDCCGRQLTDFITDHDGGDDLLERLSRPRAIHRLSVRFSVDGRGAEDVLLTSMPMLSGEQIMHRCVLQDVSLPTPAKDAQARLAAIVDSSHDAIVTKSLDGIITTWNGGAEQLFGHSAAEAVGQPVTLLIPSELRHEEDMILARLRDGETIDHYETKRVTRDGRRIDISLTISPLRNEQGAIVGASKIARDITARKRAEAALRRNERFLREVSDLLPAAIYGTDANGVLRHYNAAAARLSGRTPEIGRDKWCVGWNLYRTDGTPLPHSRCPMAVALQENRAIHGEVIIVERPDGSRSWAAAYPTPLTNDEGEVIGGINMLVDVTESKLAHERLIESEERYRRLTGLLPVAVYTCEAPTGCITYFNEAAATLWGRKPRRHDPAERYCGSVRMFLPDGRPLPHDECPMAVAVREGRGFRNREVIIERPDGSRINALVNIAPTRSPAGELTGAINVVLDVSALKDAERRLKEADRRKDEFLATLSHELRNPLAPLRHSLALLRFADSTEQVREWRALMERQVTHMVRLIDDLLDVSRITHDKLELRREAVQLSAIVEQAVETTQPAVDDAGHDLVVSLPDDAVWLHADAIRLAQVLSNLLSNACKYTEPGGRVRLRATQVPGAVKISVQDDGAGIETDRLESIFEMFTQTQRSAVSGGLGIGLTLVKRLVEMHGGSVQARSEGPGHGSQFVVTLPTIHAPVLDATRAPTTRTFSHPHRRVLVVDDNRDSAYTLSMLLSITGDETHCAYDGEQALEVAAKIRPDLVLLDLGLPKIDGYEVCRRLRDQTWGSNALIVAVSGWGQDRDQRRSSEAGFDAHLVKPVDYPELQALLASLATKRLLDSSTPAG